MRKAILLLTLCIFANYTFGLNVKNLKCNRLINPEGIGTSTPRLSWEIESNRRGVVQVFYQILVASSTKQLENNEGDLWNSNRIESNQTLGVAYQGRALVSGQDFYWKVCVFTNKGDSSWSEMAHASVGMLMPTDWNAQWIGMEKSFPFDTLTAHSRLPARYFRKEFTSRRNVKSAKIYIVGLGLYELYLNGIKLGNQVLSPVPTDYRKSVTYNTFDVTGQIKQGRNALGVILGNGRFFNMRQNTKPNKILTFGRPQMLFQLNIEYDDGTHQHIVSDKTWKISVDGPIRSNNEWDGEVYDARKELVGWNQVGYNAKHWYVSQLVAAPGGALVAQSTPNMKVNEELKPISLKQLAPDTFILDMGQNMVGWLQFKSQGNVGKILKMQFAEKLTNDGHLYTENLRSAQCTDIYIFKGKGIETYEPRFIYHGFRYVQITGFPHKPMLSDFIGKVIYDNMETTGSLETSNEMLNHLYKNAYWSIRGNYKGMPIDCPQRDERQPWLGDRATGCIGESYIFDNETLYEKWLNDIDESQHDNGQLPDMAPPFYKTYYSDNMTWPGTYLMVANMLYTQFGDDQPIINHYNSMKQWMQYMQDKYMDNFIITRDKYGDWCMPPESLSMIHSQDPSRKTDGALIATAYYYHFLQMMQKFAEVCNHKEDIPKYEELAVRVKDAFNSRFYNKAEHYYGNNTVTANLLALTFGLVEPLNEEGVFTQITYKIATSNKMHLSTGIIGNQWLMRELSKRGCVDLAYQLAIQDTYPSWGYMVKQGATTIWELWNGNLASPKMNSRNHVMLLGDLITWMYENLAGIKPQINNAGFRTIRMEPTPTENLTYVNAKHVGPYGIIRSSWKLNKGIFTWNITIPANSKAHILIPAESIEDITESGKLLKDVDGITGIRIEDKRVSCELGSGTYVIQCKYGEVKDRWKKGLIKQEFVCEKAPFPESHASSVVETSNGQILVTWFGGTKERNPDVCIWISRKQNGIWTQPQNVANGIVNDSVRYACWNPVLYQVPNGELQLYYKVGPKVSEWKGKVITSNDGGITWSPPKDLWKGYLGPIKNKPILLSNGTLLCPSSTEKGGWKVHLEATNDFGKTWRMIGPIDGDSLNAIQPSILKYSDERLQIICRSQERALLQSWSNDGGNTWSKMTKTTLPGTNSGSDAVTLQDGRQLLVYNHVLPNDTLAKGKGPRTPLNVAISYDGITWYAAAVLESSPIGQYSYPSVIQSKDGKVHIVYTWRRKAIKYVEIDPNKLILSKIVDMRWPSTKETAEVQVINRNRYKISNCDWMMLKRQKLGAIDLSARIGADGLELDMGGLGTNVSFKNKLIDKHFRDLFISECNRTGVQFSSLAMSAFYGQSFAKRSNYAQLVDECISTMKSMGIKVAFLPMGNSSDLKKNPELYPIILSRLKVVAKKAEVAGVVIGIETNLSSKNEAKLIDEVGSPSIKSYVNFSSILKRKEDIVKSLKVLGKDRIIQIHVSNTDGYWIENDPQLNMPLVKQTLDKMGWSGWLVVERSRDVRDVHNVEWNYGANTHYLQSVFQP